MLIQVQHSAHCSSGQGQPSKRGITASASMAAVCYTGSSVHDTILTLAECRPAERDLGEVMPTLKSHACAAAAWTAKGRYI